jgi:hypothetical protein
MVKSTMALPSNYSAPGGPVAGCAGVHNKIVSKIKLLA